MGGFINIRHNEPTKAFAALARRAGYKDVAREPRLQQLDGERLHLATANTSSDARCDVRVNGFIQKGKNCFFDTMVSYAGATSYLNDEPAQLYKKLADLKRG